MSATEVISAWLLSAISAWGAFPKQPHADEIHQRVAEAITTVAYDAQEPPIYKGGSARAHTALLLASLAGLETRYLERILMGHCHPDECDGGAAHGLLQVHLGRDGIRFVGPKAERCGSRAADCYSSIELADSWELQVRAGLHVYRTLGPGAYTTHLRAVGQAHEWLRAHPVPVSDTDVLSEKDGS